MTPYNQRVIEEGFRVASKIAEGLKGVKRKKSDPMRDLLDLMTTAATTAEKDGANAALGDLITGAVMLSARHGLKPWSTLVSALKNAEKV